MPLVKGDGATDEEVLQSRIRNAEAAAATGGAHHERAAHRQRDRDGDVDSRGRPAAPAARPTAARSRTSRTGTSARCSARSTTCRRSRFSGSPARRRWPGLLNLVPRYLPRYGMAPDWARASRPLVIVITVDRVPRHDRVQRRRQRAGRRLRDRRAGADDLGRDRRDDRDSATGRSGSCRSRSSSSTRRSSTSSSGRKAFRSPACSSSAIIGASLVSRVLRSTEVRIEGVEYDAIAARFVSDAAGRQAVRIIASRPNTGLPDEYARKLAQASESHHLPDDAVLFLEVTPGDASDFTRAPDGARASDVGGYRVLRCTQPGRAERDRRTAARSARSHRRDSARVLRLDRRQSASPTC